MIDETESAAHKTGVSWWFQNVELRNIRPPLPPLYKELLKNAALYKIVTENLKIGVFSALKLFVAWVGQMLPRFISLWMVATVLPIF